MKKIVFGLIGLFIVSQFLVSCSSESDVLSQFSKRKYLKKYKAKNVDYEDNIGKKQNDLASEEATVLNNEIIYVADNEVQLSGLTKESIEIIDYVESSESQSEIIANIPNSLTNDYSFWNKYDRSYKAKYSQAQLAINYSSPPTSSGGAAHWTNIVAFVTGILGVPVAAFVFGAIGVLGDKPGKIFGVLGMVFAVIWIIIILAVLI